MLTRPADSPLRVVGDDDEARSADAISASSVSASSRFGVVKPGVLAHPVHAHEEHVDVERTEGRRRDRADERVGGRAHASREDDGEVGPLLGVEDVGDRQRVRDDGQVRGLPKAPASRQVVVPAESATA